MALEIVGEPVETRHPRLSARSSTAAGRRSFVCPRSVLAVVMMVWGRVSIDGNV
jgi:hypothetical protein